MLNPFDPPVLSDWETLAKKEAKKSNIRVLTKRLPKGPKAAHTVIVNADNAPESMAPKAFEYLI